MDKQKVAYPCNEILFGNIIKWTIEQQTDLKEMNTFFLVKEPIWKGNILYESVKWHSEKVKTIVIAKRSEIARDLGEERRLNKGSTGIWGISKTILSSTIVFEYVILKSNIILQKSEPSCI